MAFTEFCCRSGGSNLNAGTRTGNSTEPGTSAFKTYTSGTWVQSTRTFTPAGGANPTTDGIAVGDFVSIYPDAATVSPYVARITTVGSTTFVTSSTAKSGTAPVDGVLNTSAKIGGAWKGPNAAEAFPFNFIEAVCTDSAGDPVRVNLKNDATYAITSGITHTFSSSFKDRAVVFEGYSSSYGDGGRFNIDGSTNAIVLMTISDRNVIIKNGIFSNNGTSGSNSGVNASGNNTVLIGCVAHDIRGNGFELSGGFCRIIDCEVYSANTSNTASKGGIEMTGQASEAHGCIAHDNTGFGFRSSQALAESVTFTFCIADTNTIDGFNINNTNLLYMLHCDAYNNSGDGLDYGSTDTQTIGVVRNCNFVLNGGYGIKGGTKSYAVYVQNCGFVDNTSGATNSPIGLQSSGIVNYGAGTTPYAAPTTGNFRINLAAAKTTGYGTFTETASSYTGTVGYPDIGAAPQPKQTFSGGLFI